MPIDESPNEPVTKKAKMEEAEQSAKKPSNTGSLIRQDLKLLLAKHEGKRGRLSSCSINSLLFRISNIEGTSDYFNLF